MSKSKDKNMKDSNNDTAYKKGFQKDELTPKERKDYELMIDLPYT